MNHLLLAAFALLMLFASFALGQTNADAKGRPDVVRFEPPWTSPCRVDPKRPYHFVNAEGHHLFVLNKTAWAFFGCKDPKGYLERAKAQGITVIRVALEGRPYYKTLGIEMWPWGGTREKPDFTTFNESYWDEVERRVRMAGEMGIGFDVVLYFTLHPADDAADVQKAYWQHAIDRLGKYANVFLWEIENENLGQPRFQDAAGTYFTIHDPYHRPVCTSAGTTNNAAWPDKRWVSVAINHSCTGSGTPGGRDSRSRHTLDGWYLAVARRTRSHGKPAFCNESGREKRHKNDDGVHRRKQGWLWCTSGCYWTWHSWDGCEGIDDAKYRAPGAEFVAPMARFFRSIPFYDMEPADSLLSISDKSLIHATLADADRTLAVTYLCIERTGGRVKDAVLRFDLPKGKYRASLLDPRDLKTLDAPDVPTDGRLALPEFRDDIIVKIERVDGK